MALCEEKKVPEGNRDLLFLAIDKNGTTDKAKIEESFSAALKSFPILTRSGDYGAAVTGGGQTPPIDYKQLSMTEREAELRKKLASLS